jgi:hypothetical protein
MRWEGHRHVKPTLSVDGWGGTSCSDYEALDAAAALTTVEVASR